MIKELFEATTQFRVNPSGYGFKNNAYTLDGLGQVPSFNAGAYNSRFQSGHLPSFNVPRNNAVLVVPDNYFPPAAPDWNATGVYMKEMVWQEQVNSLREKGFVVEEIKGSNGNAYKVSHPYYPGFVVISRTSLGKIYYKTKNMAVKGLKFVLTALVGAVSSSVFSFLRGQ